MFKLINLFLMQIPQAEPRQKNNQFNSKKHLFQKFQKTVHHTDGNRKLMLGVYLFWYLLFFKMKFYGVWFVCCCCYCFSSTLASLPEIPEPKTKWGKNMSSDPLWAMFFHCNWLSRCTVWWWSHFSRRYGVMLLRPKAAKSQRCQHKALQHYLQEHPARLIFKNNPKAAWDTAA